MGVKPSAVAAERVHQKKFCVQAYADGTLASTQLRHLLLSTLYEYRSSVRSH